MIHIPRLRFVPGSSQVRPGRTGRVPSQVRPVPPPPLRGGTNPGTNRGSGDEISNFKIRDEPSGTNPLWEGES